MNITYKIHTGWFEFYSFYLNEVKWLCNVRFFFFNCVKVATYISKGIFCPIFLKVKEISKEQSSLKVVFFTVIFKPRLKNQSIYVQKLQIWKKYILYLSPTWIMCTTKIRLFSWNEFENNFRNSTTFTFLKSASTN